VSVNQLQENRARILHYMMLIIFCILIIRFFHMQVLSGETYRKRSENNRVRQIPVLASRGIIFDSQGRVLVDNRPSYSLYLVPYEFYKNPAEAEVISSILGLSLEEIEDKINEAGNGPFTPVRIIRDMDFKTLSSVEENRLDLPGIFYQVEPVRTYPSDVRATHILGYVREVSKAELVMNQERKIYPGDVVGKSGIERYYDDILRGQRGYRYVEVNAKGREIGDFGGVRNVTAIPGKNLIFSIDIALQKVVEDRLKGKQGAVVVLDPFNGEILAMASSPDYPLEPFSIGLSVEEWESLRQDPDKPLVNRAIQGQIPPGSTFKLVLAAAALWARFSLLGA
jgi:penicillin-binding protein 2